VKSIPRSEPRRWKALCVALAAWLYVSYDVSSFVIRLDLADRHINVRCNTYMLRVVVAALLLAAAALAAVDLSGLADVVYNKSSPLERFAPPTSLR